MIAHLLDYARTAVFVGAAGVSIGVIATSLAPQWDRICRLALGHVEPAFTPSVGVQSHGSR